MARIERRQTRIRRIRARNFQANHLKEMTENSATSPDSHYSIGKTENFPEHIGEFVQRHVGDPAIKVDLFISLIHSAH
jgi:hypothetical protein